MIKIAKCKSNLSFLIYWIQKYQIRINYHILRTIFKYKINSYLNHIKEN